MRPSTKELPDSSAPHLLRAFAIRRPALLNRTGHYTRGTLVGQVMAAPRAGNVALPAGEGRLPAYERARAVLRTGWRDARARAAARAARPPLAARTRRGMAFGLWRKGRGLAVVPLFLTGRGDPAPPRLPPSPRLWRTRRRAGWTLVRNGHPARQALPQRLLRPVRALSPYGGTTWARARCGSRQWVENPRRLTHVCGEGAPPARPGPAGPAWPARGFHRCAPTGRTAPMSARRRRLSGSPATMAPRRPC